MIRLLTAHDPDELARGSILAVVEFADHYADVSFCWEPCTMFGRSCTNSRGRPGGDAARLDDVLDQFETLDEFLRSAAENSRQHYKIFKDYKQQDYTQVRDQGVGVRPLMRFLGKKWENTINAALSALAEDAARAHAARLDEFETLDEFLGSIGQNSDRYSAIFEFSNPQDYTKARDAGTGKNTLIRFLGDKWAHTINSALSALAEDAARAHAARLARATVSQPGLLRSSIIPSRAWHVLP